MTRLALLLAAVGALVLLGRVARVGPRAPAPIDDVDWLMEVMEPVYRPAYLTAAEWRN
jgi:hypothetical protein